MRYIVEQGTMDPTTDANWSFVPMPGTTVLFDTGPKATELLDQAPGLRTEPAGNGPDGFARTSGSRCNATGARRAHGSGTLPGHRRERRAGGASPCWPGTLRESRR